MDPFMAHTESLFCTLNKHSSYSDPLPQVLAPWKEEGDYLVVHIDARGCKKECMKVEVKDRMIKITFEQIGMVNRTVIDKVRCQVKVDGISGMIMLPESGTTRTLRATLENDLLTISCKKMTVARDDIWRSLEISSN